MYPKTCRRVHTHMHSIHSHCILTCICMLCISCPGYIKHPATAYSMQPGKRSLRRQCAARGQYTHTYLAHTRTAHVQVMRMICTIHKHTYYIYIYPVKCSSTPITSYDDVLTVCATFTFITVCILYKRYRNMRIHIEDKHDEIFL